MLINIYFAFVVWIINSLLCVYLWNTSQIFLFQCPLLTFTHLWNLHIILWESKATNSLMMDTCFVESWYLRNCLTNPLLFSLWSKQLWSESLLFLSHCSCLYIYVHYDRHLCSFHSIHFCERAETTTGWPATETAHHTNINNKGQQTAHIWNIHKQNKRQKS